MRIKRAALLAGLILAVTGGAAVATHTSVGLTSTLLGRGTWSDDSARAFVKDLKAIKRWDSSTVAVVRATLDAGGTTDWHGHPGPSVVVVTQGTIRVTEPTRNGGCRQTDYVANQAFVHDMSSHNFTNPGATQAEFYVTYFAPAGPLLSHAPAC